MPIPTVDGRTVEPRPLRPQYQSSNVPADAFGAAYAEAGQTVARSFAGSAILQRKHQERADDARVNADLAQYDSDRMNLLGDAQLAKGRNAIGIAASTLAPLLERARELSANLANDQQRDKMIPRLQSMISATHSALMRYEQQEGDQLAKDSAVARITSANEAASKAPTQPEIIGGAIADARAAASSLVTAAGGSDVQMDVALADATSGVWASVLQSLDANGYHALFVKTFQEHEGELNAAHHTTFAAVYKNTSEKAEAYALADSITKDSGGDYGKQIVAASEIKDPIARKAVESILDQNKNRQQAIVREAQETDADAGWSVYYQKGSPDAIPGVLYDRLLREQPLVLKAMRDDMEQKARVRAGEKFVRNDAIWGEWLYALPQDRPDPRVALSGMVGPEDMNYAMKQWADARQGVAGVTSSGQPVKKPGLSTARINELIRDAAVPVLKGSKFKTEYALFHDWARYRVDEVIEEKGFVNSEDVRAIIDKGLVDGEILTGRWWKNDPNMKGYEADEGAAFVPFNPLAPTPPPFVIPENEIPGIDAAIEAMHLIPTPERRRELYLFNKSTGDTKP